jgi:hypothetical protein
MTDTLLLSWTKLKQYTDLNDSVDDSLLKNAIREAQDIDLQRIVGTLLYEQLLRMVDTDAINLPENIDYKVLLDRYIQNFLLYVSYKYSLENIYVRPRNNGLLSPTGGENSEKVDRQIFEMKRQSAINKGEFYADKLSRYITENESQFPELQQNTLLYQQVPDYGSQYRSPIIFTQDTRAQYFNLARVMGLPIVNSAYPQYPPPYEY